MSGTQIGPEARAPATDAVAPVPPPVSARILRDPVFTRYFCARVLTGLAYQMLSVAIGWQTYALTDSAFALGLVGLVQFTPMLLLTLLVGHVADRYDRRVVAAICQSLEALVAAMLMLGSLHGWITRDIIYGLAALLGAARAFENPTVQALLPELVTRDRLSRATAWSASANQTAQIIGPALGGLLYALGPIVAYSFACGCFFATALLVAGIRKPTSARPSRATGSVFSGIAYIAAHRLILAVTTLDLVAVLFGGATALMPIFARDILATGPWGLGLLRAAPAMGALAVSIFLAARPLRPPVGRKLFMAIGVFGLATIVFGLSRALPLSMAALAVLGAADVVAVVIRQSLVQLQTPDAMRGRVSAVSALFVGTSNQLGEFESGVTAALMGTVPAAVFGGVATLVLGAVWMGLFPTLARLRDVHGESDRG